MDHEVLMQQMEERFREEFAKALNAVEDAPDGHWIDASEMAFRNAALTVARRVWSWLSRRKQTLIPRPGRPLFPPRDSATNNPAPLRDKGKRGVQVLTATGTIELRRRYFWSRSAGGTCPSDVSIGIQDPTVTSGARCLLRTLGIIHDFKHAAADLRRVAGLRVYAERLRQIVESEGRRIKEMRLSGHFEHWLVCIANGAGVPRRRRSDGSRHYASGEENASKTA